MRKTNFVLLTLCVVSGLTAACSTDKARPVVSANNRQAAPSQTDDRILRQSKLLTEHQKLQSLKNSEATMNAMLDQIHNAIKKQENVIAQYNN